MRPYVLLLVATAALAGEPASAPKASPAPPPVRVVVYEGEAVACLVDGKGINGMDCPAEGLGVSVAPIAAGAASLSTGAVTLTNGPDDEMCSHNKRVVSFASKALPNTRKITPISLPSKTYSDLLAEATKLTAPIITQLFKVDLDGDGKDEVVFSIDSGDLIYDAAGNATSYGYVGVRRIGADGQVKTHLIFEHKESWTAAQITSGEVFVAHRYGKVLGLTDMDGDGKAELLVEDGFYEGFSRTVYRVGEKVESMGSMGCGA